MDDEEDFFKENEEECSENDFSELEVEMGKIAREGIEKDKLKSGYKEIDPFELPENIRDKFLNYEIEKSILRKLSWGNRILSLRV